MFALADFIHLEQMVMLATCSHHFEWYKRKITGTKLTSLH